MHDWHLANEIIRVAEEQIKERNISSVYEVCISLGSIKEHGEEINPDNLESNLRLLSRGTVMDGANFTIKPIADKGIWILKEICSR